MSFIHKNFAKVLNQYHYTFNPGDIIVGTIFSQEQEGYLVDIGNHTAGYLPIEEISLTTKNKYTQQLILYNTQEFFILAYNTDAKQLVLSIKRLNYIRSWDRIKQLKKEDISVQAYVKGINKGGILIEIEDIQGFIPNSHLLCNKSKYNLLYKTIQCKLLVANEHNNKLICSARCAIIAEIMQDIKVGSIIQSDVIEITEFGVFFNIYGVPALLHRSELQEKQIQQINILFKPQTVFMVRIIHIDAKQGRISVSLTF
uniref:Ribosomal protein S1 n=1 Tax=Titanophycus setchellii TaxID=940129 RepID=A0A1G4NYF7_9FLOR|nr:Ribosomal protein S1 [Titanophycus setchellii]SCW23687.1 Ribosomal protein S1 [Titanophycus setchellii]